jgi:membrane-bound lytic murein transglycosylase B
MNRAGSFLEYWIRAWIFPVVIILGLLAAIPSTDADDGTASFFDALQQRLVADGYDAGRIRQLYSNEQVVFEAQSVAAYFQHNEAKLDYGKMTHHSWIDEARGYMATHADILTTARQKFGVDPKVITAIILVETKFGRYLGKRSILNTLSTMAALTEPGPREYLYQQLNQKTRFRRDDYDKKANSKSDWAYKELKAFLTYTDLHGVDPVEVVGSYAGALGIAQFMPSNILAYGQDGDGDGRIDLFVDADAIFSIASYLQNYGWKPGIDRDQAFKVVYHYNHSKYYVNTILEITGLLEG